MSVIEEKTIENEKLTDEEIIERLTNLYNELAEEFDFSSTANLKIVLSNKLRCHNGSVSYEGQWLKDCGESYFRFNKFIIKMSKILLNTFGWERFEKTFRHECAHIANMVRNFEDYFKKGKIISSHGYSFKQWCKVLNGSMSESMAGNGEFASCKSNEYLETINKYKYTCPDCGYSFPRAKRLAKHIRTNPYKKCRTCGTPITEWKEEKVS